MISPLNSLERGQNSGRAQTASVLVLNISIYLYLYLYRNDIDRSCSSTLYIIYILYVVYIMYISEILVKPLNIPDPVLIHNK